MAFDKGLAHRIEELFATRKIRCEAKRMMGGLCFMVNDKMCVGIEKDRLMVRIGPDAYESALTRKGCVPMDFTGRPMRGFVFINPEGLHSDRDLNHWLDLALRYNSQAPKSKPRQRKQPKPKIASP